MRDEEFTFHTTVMYTNGDDLVQSQDIAVLEPDIYMIMNLTNSSNIGDSGKKVKQFKGICTSYPN